MKLKYFLSILAFVVFLAGAIFFFWAFEFKGGRIAVRSESRPVIKKAVRKINAFIYQEATIHNPEGDLVPDEIDDEVKEKIRENIK